MPYVKKEVRAVTIGYEIGCGSAWAQKLTDNLEYVLREDAGFQGATEDTRLWDGDRQAYVEVYFNSLTDAVRLDAVVRGLLSRSQSTTLEIEQ